MNFYQSATPVKLSLSSTPSKELLLTNTSLSAEDCPYCEMKRKFNIGSSNDQKCLEHSLKLNLDNSSEENTMRCEEFMNGEEIVEVLNHVEASLDYYWDNLRELSGGNVHYVHKELDPVMVALKKVQEKMGRFFFSDDRDVEEIKQIHSHTTLPKKHHYTGSEKFNRNDFSAIFDPDEMTATEAIKDWVLYFNKIIQLRQAPDTGELLPYEEDLEMRIFKQSIERKFLSFTEEIGKYEKRVRDLLGKLIFYMEKSSEKVPEKQIEEDIMFIEGQNLQIESREAELEKLLLAQATAMEFLLQA